MRRNAFGQLMYSPILRFNTDNSGGGGGGEFKPITTQAEFDAAIAARIAREKAKYSHFDGVDLADLQAKAQKLANLEASQGATESDLQARLAAAETRASTAESALTEAQSTASTKSSQLERYEVAAAVGIPLSHAPRLIGATREELTADATEFRKTLRTGGYDPGQGRNDGGAEEGAAGIAEAEKRFGKSTN